MTVPDHHVVLCELPVENSAYIHYYEDSDHLADEAAAVQRMMALCSTGKKAWVERFYGPITRVGKDRYVRCPKPQEQAT
jgi:hypothetical protein